MKNQYRSYNALKAFIDQFDRRITDNLWQEIRMNSKLMFVKKNDKLIRVGSVQRYSYFIVSGSFVTSIISEEGDKKAVWFNFDNLFRIVVSPDSYYKGEPSKYEIKALEDSKVICFCKSQIDKWAVANPIFNQFYFHDVVNISVSLHEISAYKFSHTPLQFLAFLKSKYPVYFNRLSSKNMAHFLGISPEWYSKLKKRL